MSGLTILLLVLLRVAIGWHFFNEGRDHYFDKKWSSQGFLKIAVGPFAGQAKSTLPQHHHWDKLLGTAFKKETDKSGEVVDQYEVANRWHNDLPVSDPPRKEAADRLKKLKEENKKAQEEFADQLKKFSVPINEAGEKEEVVEIDLTLLANEHPLYTNPIYGNWAKMVRDDWQALVSEAERHYSYSEAQKLQAKLQLTRHLDFLYGKLEALEKDLYEYRAELRRYEKMLADPSTREVPYEKDRLAAKKKELAGKPAPWINDLLGVEDWLRESLNTIAGKEAVSKNPLPEPVPTYKKIDPIVIWLLMIGGGCMIVGLFTRLAAFALGTFLLSVVLLQPFWSPDAVAKTYFEWVEVLACYMLATTGIGRYAGLDYFINGLLGGKPAPEIEKTERTVVTKKA